MKRIIFSCIIISLFASCNKESDLGGYLTISGTLYFKSIDNINDSVILPNFPLYIQFQSRGTSSYLYSVKTDSIGRFQFTNLSKGTSYYLYNSLDSLNIKYNLQEIVTANNNNINLVLSLDSINQNGVHINVLDSLASPIGNIKLWVFNSAVLAANNDTLGSISSVNTDPYGQAYILNVDTGIYYINAKDTIGNVSFIGKDTIHVTANSGIIRNNFILY
jgi:hypothetical protein